MTESLSEAGLTPTRGRVWRDVVHAIRAVWLARAWLRVAIAVAVAAAGESGSAEIEWRWSHPEPHGNNLADLVYRDGVYAHVTDHGGIYVSTNRLVWQRRETGTLKDLRAAVFFGGRFVATGEEGTVLWSDDLVRFESGAVAPATTDWFEGVAASATQLIAVGDNGAVYRSADGTAWERTAEGVFAEWMFGAAHGEGLFVVVGEAGLIASSPDGAEWTRRPSGVTVDLNRVTFGDGRFLVVGKTGVVLSSTNGVAWIRDASTGSVSTLNTAVLSAGERLVAGEVSLALRRPPFVWQDQLSASISPAPAPAWEYAAAVWDGSRYLVGGRTGVLVESFRTNAPPFEDATFWFRQDDSPRNWLWDLAWVGGTYLAVGDQATILSSPSGLQWGLESVPESVAGSVLYGVGGSPEVGLAVGENGLILRSPGGFTNVVMRHELVVGTVTNFVSTTNQVSLMGLIWEVLEPRPTTGTLQGVGWDGTRYVLVGAGGTILTGTNTTDWTRRVTTGQEFLSAVSVSRGQWVASGAKGAIYTSPDALNWTRQASGTTNWIYRVARVGPEWLAVGEGGLILASPDGVRWLPRVSGSTAWLTAVREVGNAAYICGTQGTVLRSTNRTSWTAVPTLTGKALYGMSGRESQLVVAGAEGVVLRAITTPALSPVNIVGYQHFKIGASGVEALTFEGVPEQPFRWESSDALGAWELEAEQALDGNGLRVSGRTTGRSSHFHRTATTP